MYPEIYNGGGESRPEVTAFGKKWGWFQSFYGLASGDIFRFEAVSKLKLTEALMFMSFESDKNRLESNLIKKR